MEVTILVNTDDDYENTVHVEDEGELENALENEDVSAIIIDVGTLEIDENDGTYIGQGFDEQTVTGNILVSGDNNTLTHFTLDGDFINDGSNTSQEALIVKGEIRGDMIGEVSDRIDFEDRQQPFLARTEESGLGPPMIDNLDGIGMPVEDNGEVIGYSNLCQIPTRIDYFYKSTETDEFEHLDSIEDLPENEVDTIETMEGENADFIIMVERGTINRFIYGIAILASPDGTPAEEWNERLLYNLSGGVGIGNTQGELDMDDVLYDEELEKFFTKGFAVVHSTGLITDLHYNVLRHGETASLLKDRFVERYGEPLYTVGRGASGGAIQQYMFAQNNPEVLDGLLPAKSYPDMVTQTIHVGDGSLMEYYMDFVYPTLPEDQRWDGWTRDRWASYEDREVFHGLPCWNEYPDPWYGKKHPVYGDKAEGSSAFMEAWGGLAQLCLNPFYQKGFPSSGLYDDLIEAFGPEKARGTEFTHWQDLREVYGVDENGWARTTWDSTGVQYGLESLQEGEVTMGEFLDLNRRIGGRKHTSEMEKVTMPYDKSNIQDERTEGDLEAIESAYEEGIVFLGDVDVPIIDYRPYLDPVLDMHHFRESFTTRERIKMNRGHHKNHVIWVTHRDNPDIEDIEWKAYEVMDEWLLNIENDPENCVVCNKPDEAVDKAWDENGNIIEEGPGTWEEGSEAYEKFTPYSTSRMLAGSPSHGLMFKPELMPVEEAFERGYYGDPEEFDENEKDELIEELEEIFPDGVADYEEPDQGMPADIQRDLGLEDIVVEVEIHPETLNLRSQGRWVTAYIELSEEYDINDNDIDSVRLIYNYDEIEAEWGKVKDGNLMVKFDRGAVTDILETGNDVEIIITGVVDDVVFEGTDEIGVIEPGEDKEE